MSRYIDADELYRRVKTATNPYGKPTLDYESGVKVLDMIKQAPTADVVEVVRCKDCKHLEIINSREVYAKCRMTDLEFKPFDIDTRKHYCSYSERSENGKS